MAEDRAAEAFGHPLGVEVCGEVPDAWKFGWGTEFDFIVLDTADHVAVFCCSGFGPVPLALVGRWDEECDAIDRVMGLPVTTVGLLRPGLDEGKLASYQDYARRGLFVFDFDDTSAGIYRLLTAPAAPTSASAVSRVLPVGRAPVHVRSSFEGLTEVDFRDVAFPVVPGWGAHLRYEGRHLRPSPPPAHGWARFGTLINRARRRHTPQMPVGAGLPRCADDRTASARVR